MNPLDLSGSVNDNKRKTISWMDMVCDKYNYYLNILCLI